MQEYCDWCFASLTQRDRARPANQLLWHVDAQACSDCLKSGKVLSPPESLDVAAEAWKDAVIAVYDGDQRALDLLRAAAGYEGEIAASPLVSTERLGTPGPESSWFERRGYTQRNLVYPNGADTPTATCHIQPSPAANALCGFPWERLVGIPGALALAELPDNLRCPKCWKAIQKDL